jgi:Uma2 family endonuclease
MRVLVAATGLYTYPDAVVVCGDPQFTDQRFDTLTNPNLIVEALLPSTEANDRGRKFEQYAAIASLQEYLLIASDRVHVDLYTQQPDGRWLLTSANRMEDALELESVGCRVGLVEVYEKVDLEGPQTASA